MKTYELVYIVSSQGTLEQSQGTAKEVENFIQSKEGIIVRSEKTNPQVLAYPIKKQSSGYFFILQFQLAEHAIKELREKLEKDKAILRHFIVVKKPVKKMKERRTRSTLAERFASLEQRDAGKKTEQPSTADIDKKLDEILSE